jgi:hypothetical protein
MSTTVIRRIFLLGPTDPSCCAFDTGAAAFSALLKLGVLFTTASIFDIPLSTHNAVTRENVRRVSIPYTAIQSIPLERCYGGGGGGY